MPDPHPEIRRSAGPIVAGGVRVVGKGGAVKARARENVVVAAVGSQHQSVVLCAGLGQRRLLIDEVGGFSTTTRIHIILNGSITCVIPLKKLF